VKPALVSGLACLLAASFTLASSTALAAGASDEEVRQLIDAIYESEYRQGKFKDALEKLDIAKVLCEGNLCSKRVKGQLLVAVGTMHARLGESGPASKAFAAALREDPNAELRKEAAGSTAEAEFEKVKPSRNAPVPSGCRGTFKEQNAPKGWTSAEAYHCHQSATRLQQSGKARACIDDARASLELEDTAFGHAVLARCLEDDNNWTDAVEEWEEAARQAPKARQVNLAQQAQYRSESLRRKIPVVILVPPQTIPEGFSVEVDGVTLPVDALGTEMPLNPGDHTVVAVGKRGKLPLRFSRKVHLEGGNNLPIDLELTPYSPEIKCLLSAQNAEAIARCLNRGESTSSVTVRVRSEFSGYHDTMNVDVLSPSVAANAEHVTGGWGIGASMLVDMVTAASVDIVATASPRWREVRYVPALNGHKRFGDVDVGLSAGLSREPDYLSTDVGARATMDFLQKTVTPTIAYSYSHDVNAKAQTPWEIYAKHINRHALNFDVGLVLTKATFASITSTMVFESGDSSKPYRHIPLFDARIAPLIRPGETIDSVNLFRLPERPLEQLPVDRKRFAIAGQVAHRFANSTLRGSQRLYTDTWGLMATTTDVRYLVDLTKDVRVWPHARFHAQSGTNFYQLAYTATPNPDGTTSLPVYRTGDRELGPLLAGTFGAGVRYDFGAQHNYGVAFSGDVVYTRFSKTLFALDRWGYFGALNFEAVFD
jgi:tetratricopeptide (TPR) repeat protein